MNDNVGTGAIAEMAAKQSNDTNALEDQADMQDGGAKKVSELTKK